MILFVCSQGKIRSRTAEVIAVMGGVHARSCGTDKDALAPITNALLRAADTIICMEQSHVKEVKEYMGAEGKNIVSLGIEDVWNPFDPMLIERLILFVRHRLGDDVLSSRMQLGHQRMLAAGIDFFDGGVISGASELALFH
ncbi:sulfate adenylyltransferase subunit 1 [Novimethylophilus kurashikiensis]|uniref:Sulfate adenylyltransferase subunit 1 n=1 Tax=Novimethylophilus kurashikiensis TaxID=1825523 RepID=A0A2R5FC34_9PROT|nr:hypothetical protein [Novimethylophilus kurashikiensis]GBG14261.1 sulfate adenylyltransferase subunit 1 [Novimethylophilus kurashikiensis]